MTELPPAARKFDLTAHVVASVGWLGAVAAFLALAVAGLASRDAQAVRGAYVAMALVGWTVIVPACVAALATGVVQSLGTAWGLFRHYWVVIKLAMTVAATAVLLLHMRPIDEVARAAAAGPLGPGDLRDVRRQLVADAAAALAVLLVTTTLSVYKPRGLTAYGRRKAREQRHAVGRP